MQQHQTTQSHFEKTRRENSGHSRIMSMLVVLSLVSATSVIGWTGLSMIVS